MTPIRTLMSLLLLLPLIAVAEVRAVNGLDIHYTVLPTTQLSADVARAYDLPRANNLAFVNISVTDNGAETVQGVMADISGSFRNLVGQSTRLEFRTFSEGDAVYYIATFEFAHRERLRFRVSVTPEGSDQTHTLEFDQEIYREDRP